GPVVAPVLFAVPSPQLMTQENGCVLLAAFGSLRVAEIDRLPPSSMIAFAGTVVPVIVGPPSWAGSSTLSARVSGALATPLRSVATTDTVQAPGTVNDSGTVAL